MYEDLKMKPAVQILASTYLLWQKPSSEVLRRRKSATKAAEELAQYKASWKYKMRRTWIGFDQMEDEIALRKYALSSGGMTGGRALRWITHIAVFQGLIDVSLKTCGIGYTLDYNAPAEAVKEVIKTVTGVDSSEAYDRIDNINAILTQFRDELRVCLSGESNPPPK